MNNETLPAWKLPSTVLFLDDNFNFLKSLQLSLDPLKMAPVFFNELSQAESFINHMSLNLGSGDEISSNINEAGFQQTNLNISTIHKKIYDPKRFNHLSVVVLDYAMPEKNGIEFAALIKKKHNHLKILLLTGEANEKIAVNGFNDGIIDKFIRKDATNFQDDLNNSIDELQLNYFIRRSFAALGENSAISCLKNTIFIEKFNEICNNNNIVEYYLANTDGGFILLDVDANTFLLTVKDDENAENDYQIALYSDDGFPEDLLIQMETKEKIICSIEDKIYDELIEVERLLHPAKKIPTSKANYYYALTNCNDQIAHDKITSYKSFLDTHSTFPNQNT